MSELKYTTQASKAAHEVREAAGLPWLFNGGTVSGDLPDINVWLALAVEEHPHHAAAKQYWDSVQAKPAGERNLWFCRVTMLGLVRLLSQPKVMGQGVLNLVQAMALYQQFRAVAGVDLLAEPKQCDSVLQGFGRCTFNKPTFTNAAMDGCLSCRPSPKLRCAVSEF